MSQQDNFATLQRFGEAVNSGNLATLRDLIAPTALDHDPAPDQGLGPEGFIKFFTGFRAAFPDLAVAVDHVVADDDNIAMAYTITGTHQGDFLGVPATGRKISARGMQIARFENGQMVERWGSSDQLGILQQLGVDPTAQ
ncbi:MAG: ester cyclase [Leptolyngbya sp. BL-A-14]